VEDKQTDIVVTWAGRQEVREQFVRLSVCLSVRPSVRHPRSPDACLYYSIVVAVSGEN
jgi:hypothetical protein